MAESPYERARRLNKYGDALNQYMGKHVDYLEGQREGAYESYMKAYNYVSSGAHLDPDQFVAGRPRYTPSDVDLHTETMNKINAAFEAHGDYHKQANVLECKQCEDLRPYGEAYNNSF